MRLTVHHAGARVSEALMADLSNAFIALPGGFGTLDEFCEVLTWSGLLNRSTGHSCAQT